MSIKKDSLIIYLKNHNLEFISFSGRANLEFPENIVRFQEIIDKPGFVKLLTDFVTKTGLKDQQATIILSADLIFQKDLQKSNLGQTDVEIINFLNKVPFNKIQVSYVQPEDKSFIHIYAANNYLYQIVKEVLEGFTFRVLEVLPALVFEIIDSKTLNDEEIDQIMKKKSSLKSANFISRTGNDKSNKDWWQYVILFAAIAILAVGTIFFIVNFLMKKPAVAPQSVLPVVSATVVPTQAVISKNELTLQILNGSGVAGQAAKIKTQLESAGFSNITADNYTGVYNGNSLVSYTTRVSGTFVQEIIDNLKNSVASISAEATSSAKTDIVIILGK